MSKAPASTSSSNSLGDFKPGSEPGGFGNINWGSEIHTLSGMEYVTTDTSFLGVRIWTKKNDELKMGSATLDKILYSFWLGKFSSVRIYTKGSVDWAYLRDAIFKKFGKGNQDNKDVETYEWFGKITSMMLKYDEISKIGFLYMRSTEISTQQTEHDKQKVKEGAKEGF